MKLYRIIFSLLLLGFIFDHQKLHAQPLDSLLQMAVSNNPALKALELEYQAEKSKIDQVSQLPNPQVGIGIPILRPETRLGPQLITVSASQLFPWFGTFDAKKDVVLSMTKARFEKISALKLELFFVIKSNYYQLLYFNEKQVLITNDLNLLEILEELALSKVESGTGSITDVLRIQIKQDELKQQYAVAENSKNTSQAAIQAITKLPFDEAIVLSDTTLPLLDLNFDLTKIKDDIAQFHPLINMLNAEIEASSNRIALNKSMNNPSIGIGLDYSVLGERIDANPIGNGRDILIPKVMIGIPLYRKSYKATNEMEDLNQLAIELNKENIQNQMIGQLITYRVDYENAIELINLSKKQITKANQTYQILLTNYGTNSNGFDDLLTIQNDLIKYNQQLLLATFQANVAVAKIEKFTNF